MALYEGNLASGEGGLITMLDEQLVKNDKWSIYDDAAGTNCRVYKNDSPTENSLFYLKVDDNYAGYAIIELWEGWDATAHAGTGKSLTKSSGGTNLLYIRKAAQAYKLMLNNLRFILIQVGVAFSSYVGQPKRFDESKNQPIVICTPASAKGNNNLGRRNYDYTTDDSNSWRALFDNNGNNSTVLPFACGYYSESYNNQYFDMFFIATGDGKFMIYETPVWFWTDTKTFGQLDGVMNIGRSGCPLAKGDIVYVDTIPWLYLDGSGYSYSGRCLVRLT